MGESTPSHPSQETRIPRRGVLKLTCGMVLGGVAASGLGALYATALEPHWLDVQSIDISLGGWPPSFPGMRLIQLSDFHLGAHGGEDDLRQSVECANQLEPDLVVLTGDFVLGSADYGAACAQELSQLRAPLGVYAVLGNHDVWTDPDVVAGHLSAASITVLRNQRRVLEFGDGRLWLLGIEDAGYSGGFFGDFRSLWQESAQAFTALMEGIPEEEPRLLLVHNPDFTEMLPAGRIDLALCGHTHGGQVRLPLVGAPFVPSCFGQKYVSGLVQGPSTLVYVNRGSVFSPQLYASTAGRKSRSCVSCPEPSRTASRHPALVP